jgi:hypothetical protein
MIMLGVCSLFVFGEAAPPKAVPPIPAPSSRVEPRVRVAPVPVPFEVVQVARRRRPKDQFPWHEPGGPWTFLEARLKGAVPAAFTIGLAADIDPERPTDTTLKMLIVAASRDDGDRLVQALARGANIPPPKPLKPGPLRPRSGDSQVTWQLPEDAEQTAPRLMRLDLGDALGGFEIDVDWRARSGAFRMREESAAWATREVALALRDGIRPRRTPATDPRISTVGPRLGPGRALPGCDGGIFCPGGTQFVYHAGDPFGFHLLMCHDMASDGRSTILARFSHGFEVELEDSLGDQMLIGLIPGEAGRPRTGWKPIWWLDRPKGILRELRGPWDDLDARIPRDALAPDRKHLVIESLAERGERSRTVVHLVDTATWAVRTIREPEGSVSADGWVWNGEIHLRCRMGPPGRQIQKSIDPRGGEAQAWQARNPPTEDSDGADPGRSPDGLIRARWATEDSLEFLDETARTAFRFRLHEDDVIHRFRGQGFEWLSPRYLSIRLDRFGFLDTRTLTMSFPESAQDGRLEFSGDFRFAIRYRDGVPPEICRVILPPD